MKVLLVTQYYPPEPVPIPSELAHALAERGHSVRVITGYPNYPTGSLYPGYRPRRRHREWDGDVRVRRVRLVLDHSDRLVRRLANYASFAMTSVFARREARGADVIYVYATQMTAALGPWLWSFAGGAPYVLHVQDLWPDSITGSSIVGGGKVSRLIDAMLTPWLRSVYRRAAAVIAIAPTMRKTLIERGARAAATHLVYNWAESAPQTTRIDASSPDGAVLTRVVYAGNVGDMQDLETVVRAAHSAAHAGIVLAIVGDGVARPRLRDLVAELGCRNVVFEDPVPREEMAGVYQRADFGLVTLKDLPAFCGTIPSKLQAVLASGLPVITTVPGDVRKLVEERGCGLVAEAGRPDSLANALRLAASAGVAQRRRMALQALSTYESLFSRVSGLAELESVLKSAIRERGKR